MGEVHDTAYLPIFSANLAVAVDTQCRLNNNEVCTANDTVVFTINNDTTFLAEATTFSCERVTTTFIKLTVDDNSANTEPVYCSSQIKVKEWQVPVGSASTTSSGLVIYAAAGGGGALLLLLLPFLVRNKQIFSRSKAKILVVQSGYADLITMSGEFILERAPSIQTALLVQRQLAAPAMITAGAIHPNRKFIPPPTDLLGLLALQNFIRETFNKEIPRERIAFGVGNEFLIMPLTVSGPYDDDD